jgi:hypothetical protein
MTHYKRNFKYFIFRCNWIHLIHHQPCQCQLPVCPGVTMVLSAAMLGDRLNSVNVNYTFSEGLISFLLSIHDGL